MMARRDAAARTRRVGWRLAGALAVAAAAVLPARAPSRAAAATMPTAFAWLVPTAAPPGWPRSTLTGLPDPVTIASPPGFTPISGDPGTVSFAVPTPHGLVKAYLNVTPRQGDERLHGFATFRVHRLADEHDERVREEASVEGVAFPGGRASCVLDRYVTRVGHHTYREIACLLVGPRTGAVVVAAATTAAWRQYEAQLRQAVASFALA